MTSPNRISLTVQTEVSQSLRAQQVCSMFDAPPETKCEKKYDIDFPWDAQPWNVGLVVGPSGSGKSTVLKHVWGERPPLKWSGAGIIDDFADRDSVEKIANAIGSVGFSTPPAWLRPHRVLSMGEQFRAEIARRILSDEDPIVVDEYTSVVDRQVAQVASHAIQRYVRKEKRKFIAVGCHYDVIDWLQPDWILDMATQTFTRRLLQRRPAIRCTIGRLPRAAWGLFAPFHYMSADLPSSCHGFGIWANGTLACSLWLAVLPHPKAKDIIRVARVVTLPDFQGIGLAFTLLHALGSALKAAGKRLRNYPAHPSFIEAHKAKSDTWLTVHDQAFGQPTGKTGKTQGDRFVGVFEYCGPANPRFATTLGVHRGLGGESEVAIVETKPDAAKAVEKPANAWQAHDVAPLLAWIPSISPELAADTSHLAAVEDAFSEALGQLQGHQIDPLRLICTIPIRHFKTETFLHGVVWLLEHIPTLRIVFMTHSHERAKHVGKRLREIAERSTVGPTRGWNEIHNWQNAQGGGVIVMSAEQSKEGHDCHVLLVDDPVDEHGAKDSQTREVVDRAINYYTARCMRQGRPGPVMLVMSRQHPDDPAGRRIARTAVKWRHLHAEAIVDLGLPTERAFAPHVWPLEQLKLIRAELKESDPYETVFWSRYQGRPIAEGASFYKEPARYVDLPTWPGFRDAIGIDMSYSSARSADWFAGVLVRFWGARAFVVHALRVRPDPRDVPGLVRELRSMAAGGTAPVFSYISGPEVGVVGRLNTDHGLNIQGIPARVNKLWRTQRTIGKWNGGDVLVPANAPWAGQFIKRVQAFSGLDGDEDDESDALVSVCDAMLGLVGQAGPGTVGPRRI